METNSEKWLAGWSDGYKNRPPAENTVDYLSGYIEGKAEKEKPEPHRIPQIRTIPSDNSSM